MVEEKILHISHKLVKKHHLEGNHIDLLMIDENFRIEYLSKDFVKRYALDEQKLLGAHITTLNVRFLPKKSQIFNKKNHFKNVHFVFNTSSHTTKHLLLSGLVLNHEKKKYAVIFWNDITEIESYRKKYIHSEMELNTLIYKISHDLRGPVATMKGILNVMNIENQSTENLKYLNYFNQQLQKLDNSIFELTKVSDLNVGKLNLQSEVDVHRVVYESLQNASKKHNLYNVVYKFNINLMKKVYLNEYVITSIFNNLWLYCFEDKTITNHYEIMLDIHTSEDRYLNIRLIHSGKTTTDEQIERAFMPFFKMNLAPNTSNLYLFTLKKFIDYLEGNITMSYKNGVGTILNIDLPALEKK